MFFSFCKKFVLFSFFCLVLAGSQTVFAGDDWREVSPADLASKAPKVDPNADAEAIFWEVRVDDGSDTKLVMKHYLRVKIYTENGREKYSKVDIPFIKGVKIKDIEARVIKPDGSIVELTKADVFEREVAKADKIKVKAKSFAIPGIDIGVIVEYRYKEIYPGSSAEDMRMLFQHDIPIQNITYYFKPYNDARVLSFNMSDTKFIKEKGGFYRATMENVPAIVSEPNMPPEDEVRSWTLVYYDRNRKSTSMDFWSRAGGYIAYAYDIKDALKPDKEIKNAAPEIATGATTPEDKIAKLFEFCKTKINNITYDTSLTDEQKEEIKPNKSPKNTLKNMRGTSSDVNELFASLADALGFEARFAFGGDTSEKFFNVRQAHESFIHFSGVAVKVNGRWQYYDPGSYFTPYGMLQWYEENTDVLLLAYKDFITTQIPVSNYEDSVAKRTAKLKLLEDGTLEGDVRIEYTGHLSYQYKMDNYDASPNQREETLKESIKETLSTAEISNIRIENVDHPEKPFVYSYKIKVPNYAQKAGKRMFLQPGFFTSNEKPMFSSATRKYDVFFRFPWSEKDDIEISLPKGFELDNADAPTDIADPERISSLKFKVSIDRENNFLQYKREFHFGGGGNVLFPSAAYPAIKNLFDAFNKADTHTIVIKQN